jgi:hypothetical protein
LKGGPVTQAEALDRLDELKETKRLAAGYGPPSEADTIFVEHPIPRSKYKRGVLPEEYEEAVEMEIPTSKLRAQGQTDVTKGGVEHYIKEGGRWPEVIKKGNEYIVWDGHHRATAAILMGEQKVLASVAAESGKGRIKP